MMLFKCFDFETTSVDVQTCEVVQAAYADASPKGVGLDLAAMSSRSMLFHAASIPAGATAVHGITAEKVADAPKFASVACSFAQALTALDVVSVSFNGCGYDIPILARYLARVGGIPSGHWMDLTRRQLSTCEDIEAHIRSRHIDVMRLWARARSVKRVIAWTDSGCRNNAPLTADMFAGSLMAAHGFWLGEGFADAHDAAVDCRKTLTVLDAMLRACFVDVATAIRWSNEPLPGDVDFAGKFKWDGDRAIITIGKQIGSPIEDVDTGFLRWMLDKGFPRDTKDVVRKFLAGEYPVRKYEDET